MPGNDDLDYSLEELDALFADDDSSQEDTSPANDEGTAHSASQQVEKDVEKTQAFAHRLREKTDKAVAEERERIAKDMGYESYEAMQKRKEAKLLEDSGLNPDDVSPVVEKLVEERLKNDPRLKELEGYRERQMQEFAKKELNELNKLTGGDITSLDQVPQDVLDDWKKTGSLKKSYIALHGEELIVKARTNATKSTTSHLQSGGGTPPPPATERPLTADEKAAWRVFYPGISEEELNKKTVKKES